MKTIDLSSTSVRVLNQSLHGAVQDHEWRVTHPGGKHNLAVGINADVAVDIEGHAGYYCANMNQQASVTVHGNVGVGVAENMMSGSVRVKGSASQAAGATAHGGLLVIDCAALCRSGLAGAPDRSDGRWAILGAIKLTIGLRASREVEEQGLDLAEHNERAYNL